MARILIAATSEDVEALNRTLGTRHDLAIAIALPDSIKHLENQEFELVMIDVRFDESRMFELLRDLPKLGYASKPIICFSTRDTPMLRKMHASIESSCRAFGAWIYLDRCTFKGGDTDSELLRIVERCLTDEERRAIQSSRIEIHHQRKELLQLRLELEAEDWSLDLEDQVATFRERLAEVLLRLSELQIDNIAQLEKIAESTAKTDRVSLPVSQKESELDRAETKIGLQESEQLGKEQEIIPEEESKAKLGRRELATLDANNDPRDTASPTLIFLPSSGPETINDSRTP